MDQTPFRGIFRTWSKSIMELFYEKSEWLIPVIYIRQKAPYRCLADLHIQCFHVGVLRFAQEHDFFEELII